MPVDSSNIIEPFLKNIPFTGKSEVEENFFDSMTDDEKSYTPVKGNTFGATAVATAFDGRTTRHGEESLKEILKFL